VRLELLLIRRDLPPFRGDWALPGGFVRENEDLPEAAGRELEEEAGLKQVVLYQVGAVGTPGRDPRGHTVTVLFVGLSRNPGVLSAGGDATSADWFVVNELPKLAFDHAALVTAARASLRERVEDIRFLQDLLPAEFTLAELQGLTEAVLGTELDVRNFRRKVREEVVATGGVRREGAHRPAQLFRFARGKSRR
jgi:8-oxo-dGTP diphosphatase